MEPESSPQAESTASVPDSNVPLFGARRKARELVKEVEDLRAKLDRLGAFSVLELEAQRDALRAEIEDQRQRLEEERKDAEVQLIRQAEESQASLQEELEAAKNERDELTAQLTELKSEVVTTEETALLQEAGVYEYRHPLSDSVEYKEALKTIKGQVKEMTRADGGAVRGNTNWTVNGSVAQGRKMVRDFSKLMLRAYNAEADNLARGMKPYKLESAVERLTKVAATIARLGRTMDIHISGPYHELRVYELELTADYREKQAEEKEKEREERERLREEQRAQKEMEKERARLEKERQHYLNSLEILRAKGDTEAINRLESELGEIEKAISDVDYRAANVRAGYVYVISNLGSFGEGIVKVGLTRRLEPLDRVRELGDASVPFRFDVHAIHFSDDAVGIEAELHQRLADRRVNKVNMRREFFYATPAEVKKHLLDVAGDLLSFEETPEALEYHQSQAPQVGASSG
jgi:DNA repair exonuclease SbcCD ATPase subunit